MKIQGINAEKAQAVIDAWCVEGRSPEAHAAAKRQLRKDWPALYKAVKALSEG